jgi:hypothetical protein
MTETMEAPAEVQVDTLPLRPPVPESTVEQRSPNPGLRKGLFVAGGAAGLLAVAGAVLEAKGVPVVDSLRNIWEFIRPPIDPNNIPTPQPGPPVVLPGK